MVTGPAFCSSHGPGSSEVSNIVKCHCLDVGWIQVNFDLSACQDRVLVILKLFSAQRCNSGKALAFMLPVPSGPGTPFQFV